MGPWSLPTEQKKFTDQTHCFMYVCQIFLPKLSRWWLAFALQDKVTRKLFSSDRQNLILDFCFHLIVDLLFELVPQPQYKFWLCSTHRGRDHLVYVFGFPKEFTMLAQSYRQFSTFRTSLQFRAELAVTCNSISHGVVRSLRLGQILPVFPQIWRNPAVVIEA